MLTGLQDIQCNIGWTNMDFFFSRASEVEGNPDRSTLNYEA